MGQPLPVDPDPWQAAACYGKPGEWFFPESDRSKSRAEKYEHGKAVCARCPIRDQCLEFALANRETEGLWGGLDERERAAVLRARRAAQKNLVAGGSYQ